MLTLNGTVWNVFQTDKKVNKDGEEYGGVWKVQLMADVPNENGTFETQVVNLKTKNTEWYKANEKKQVLVPVGAYSPPKDKEVFFFESGKPRIIKD